MSISLTGNRFYRAKLWLLGACLFLSCRVEACPGLVLVYQIDGMSKGGISRDQLSLYRFSAQSGSPAWKQIPLQLDPLDSEGSLLFPEGEEWRRQPVGAYDRLSFSHKDLGEMYDGSSRPPCAASRLIELKSNHGYAYLAVCEQSHSQRSEYVSPVSFDSGKRTVSTSLYHYNYSEKNHLVFDKIELLDGKREALLEVAKNSDLLIASDVKNFFTLYFDTNDIDAQINKKRFGPMGLMGGLQFYLRILLFRLELALLPEVNFFEDALFMPMSMTLPVNAPKYLRRGSGIYYTWEPGNSVEWLVEDSQIQELNLDHLDPKGQIPLAKGDDKFCQKNICRYNLLGKVKDRLFSLNFSIHRKAADWGFFPRLIRNVEEVEKKIQKPLSRYSSDKRVGVYFETARLPKGSHTWDFWIHFPEKVDATCIRPINTKIIF
jgi:hypothetical protein